MTSSGDHPLWHGAYPMGPFLRNLKGPDRFLTRGEGRRVWDRAGREYLDAGAGSWHGTLGYGHPGVIDAIRRQCGLLPLGGTVYHDRPPEVAVRFAGALAERLPAGLRRIRLGSGGAQMVEAAVLLSRFHRAGTGAPDRTAVITLLGGFHGMTTGTLPLSGAMAAHAALCGPLPGEVYRADHTGSWTAEVAALIDRLGGERVTAVVVEPLMGVAGVCPEPADLVALGALCRSHGIHLIADEVTTGCGRAGAITRTGQLGIVPDMLVLGPALTGGYLASGALAVSEDIFGDLADPPSGLGLPHGSAADGNPLVGAAGLAVLQALYEDGLLEAVAAKERRLRETLSLVRDEHVPAGAVAGAGLFQLLELRAEDGDRWLAPEVTMLCEACAEHGLLAGRASGSLCLVPPLTITDAEIQEIGERLDDTFRDCRRRLVGPGAPR